MKKKWRFKLKNNAEIDLKKYLGKIDDRIFLEYVDDGIEIVGSIVNGKLTILKGYEWDGCTPKFSFLGVLFGVPDFKKTYLASLVHDFLIEYFIQNSLTRKQIDLVFEKILKENDFKLEWLYSNSVHLFRIISAQN